LWTEAAASAAGGTPLADLSTKAAIELLSKFVQDAPGQDPIDLDDGVNSMRNTYGYIQNSATAPMYHVAGSGNICLRLNIWGNILTGFLASRAKFCGNGEFPGGYGDGAVPVASAGGYSDTGAHPTLCDSPSPANKYTLRAYEQCALFPEDHIGMLTPLVQYGSIRMAVPKTATCANTPDGAATDPNASIVYDDVDSSITSEIQPAYLLNMCGNNVFAGAAQQYSTCLPEGTGCCTNFSNGSAGSCTCGESLCIQSQFADISYFTGASCTGTEYSGSPYQNNFISSWDGKGVVGEATNTVTVSSQQNTDGSCQDFTREMGACSCPQYNMGVQSLGGMHRVYRAQPSAAPTSVSPDAYGDGTGWVISNTCSRKVQCN
jgi:hypothetical protein